MLIPFLMLRAFAAGTTALTGVEAISNAVPAFRFPQSRNAATTLAVMGAISISMFLGISTLTQLHRRSLLGAPRRAANGGRADRPRGVRRGVMFFVIQIMTAAILILAADTAYADFPRLTSILAIDRFMPRQFMNRGDRLVFSNGIVILAVVHSVPGGHGRSLAQRARARMEAQVSHQRFRRDCNGEWFWSWSLLPSFCWERGSS
ncbi:MAG: hypothetical protein M3124_05810 [Actinomycetota bacterium]|nr:hypothetical protein [Actinomycetota bacterium]